MVQSYHLLDQISKWLYSWSILETDDVAVMIDAQHYCVKSRGVEDTGSSTVTTKLGGGFKTDPAARAEFLSIARMGKWTRY